MSIEKVKVGVVGCGNISDAYFKASQTFKWLDVGNLFGPETGSGESQSRTIQYRGNVTE